MASTTTLHPLAGKPAPPTILVDVPRLEREFLERIPDPGNPRQMVSFGTSGHRGTSLDGSLTAAHIVAITQAICDYRRSQRIDGPLYMGKDTHALSRLAQSTALEVLAANDVETIVQRNEGFTPTPAISRAILVWNRSRKDHLADGIVITPSHNPPEDGGFKYNPPNGGPAETSVTRWIQRRANELLESGNAAAKRVSLESALRAPTIHQEDLVLPYVDDLGSVIDMEAICGAGVTIGVDPLGGASLPYWEAIASRYRLKLTIVNQRIDPTFGFMSVDHDGRIRMDCSSPFAMAGLVALKDRFQVAVGNDPDADRHGIVTASSGLMNPNHFLAVAIRYLLSNRPRWSADMAIGKTVVSSGLIDVVTRSAGRRLKEVPVGFKWFAPMLFDGTVCFGGEESAGASFLRRDGTVWTTDKDGLILALLAAEITAITGKDPGMHYQELTSTYGTPYYTRIDAPATREQKARLQKLSPEEVNATHLGGEPILTSLTRAPGNGEPIDGLKVVTSNGWFAARPSGTEDVYKIYAESFRSPAHLDRIVLDAQRIVDEALAVAR
ncbi:MAG TPA: phosphoglucomutase (alpha-D-glucose-1,6-bisphosphate-dependent) [Vicinamibacterales bacterium]|jgi:phosphoglucomutase|nr:phosphoglucomutase (alpha-D-glucose-1,6-bisphosphate-dependent) [Vicinamibacterales bacterium]